MLSSFSSWFVNLRRNPLARLHMLTISNRLKNYGLRYDDLYDPYFDLDIKEALGTLPREVVDARHQRLKRADASPWGLQTRMQGLSGDRGARPLRPPPLLAPGLGLPAELVRVASP